MVYVLDNLIWCIFDIFNEVGVEESELLLCTIKNGAALARIKLETLEVAHLTHWLDEMRVDFCSCLVREDHASGFTVSHNYTFLQAVQELLVTFTHHSVLNQ